VILVWLNDHAILEPTASEHERRLHARILRKNALYKVRVKDCIQRASTKAYREVLDLSVQ
jgi:hypothetical protein